jgi:hypothetical protein
MAGIERLLTLLETAETLRVSPHTVRAFVRKGKLFPVRICRRLLFRPADVEKLIAASMAQSMAGCGSEPADDDQIKATAGENRRVA